MSSKYISHLNTYNCSVIITSIKLHFTCLILLINNVMPSGFSAIKYTYRFDKSSGVKFLLFSDQAKYTEQRKGCIIALKW